MSKPERVRRNTVILIVSLLGVFLALYLIQRMRTQAPSDETSLKAVIQIDGERVYTMDLNGSEVYTAKTADGHYNVVTVDGGGVQVTEADCENQVCVKTGQIRYPGEVIACMPHKLIVFIE